MLYFYFEQECIPVGCVPAARRPYAGVCFRGGGGLGSAWSGGGGLPGPGGGVVSQHALRQTPPVNRMNDRQV